MWNYRIGTVTGIPIRVNITLLVFLPVIVWLIGNGVSSSEGAQVWANILESLSGHEVAPESLSDGNTPWILGTAAAVGLFFGVTVHELGHAWTARVFDINISSITLWIFGGMAHMDENPDDWRAEFWIAIAGPITSVLVGIAFYIPLRFVPAVPELIFLLGWLALMNVILAIFNMVPAFPMDGGRILRALLARNRPYAQATRTAATVAKFLAVGMAILGLLGSPILVLIALFVYIAASSESKMTVMRETLAEIRVGDLMTHDVRTVSPDTTVQGLIDKMLVERHTGYPVVDNAGNPVGIVTLADARDIAPHERDGVRVSEIMTEDIVTVAPDEEAFEALMTVTQNSFGRLIVEENGEIVGIISRTDLMNALEVLQTGGEFADKRVSKV